MATATSLFPTEVILYTTSSSSSAPGSMAITNLAAPSSTSSLISFKGLADPAPHSIDFVPTQTNASLGGTGGLVFQLEASKAMLNVYSFQRDHPVLRIILPQKLSCLSASPNGDFVAAGSSDGRIFVWSVSTGDLLASFDAHYRSITVLKWSHDGQALVTASQDTRILVWSLAGLLAPSQQSSSSITSSSHNPTPYCTLADHNLAVTDLEIGSGAFPHHTTLLSSSLDSTVKLWDLRTRSLLATFVFEQPVGRIVMDPTERFFFASTAAGGKDTIYRVDLFRKKQVSSGHTAAASSSAAGGAVGLEGGSFVTPELAGLRSWEARGGGPTSEPERIAGPSTSPPSRPDGSVIPLPDSVSSLALSLNATFLLVGSVAGTLHIIDVSNSQILKTVSLLGPTSAATAAKNAVTNLRTLKRPRDLPGGWDAGGAPSASASASLPIRPVSHFQRQAKGEDDRSDLVYTVRVPAQPDAESWIDPVWDGAMAVGAGSSGAGWTTAEAGSSLSMLNGTAGAADQAEKVELLTREVEVLRSQLGRAKRVNDEIWHRVVRERVEAAVAAGSDR